MMPSPLPPPPGTSLDSAPIKREEQENGGEEARRQEEEEEEELAFGREEARKMLDYLSDEQLHQVLQDATLRHADVLDEVRRNVDGDLSQRKIFVRGLSWGTTTPSLITVFSQYGDVEEGAVIMDRNTGKSKGYGFITFKHLDAALLSLKEPSKKIDGRIAICRLASIGPSPVLRPQDLVARKIYVGNVPLDIPPDRLLSLFSQYGEIEEGPLGLDRQAGKSRGFALFIYRSAEDAQRALEEPVKDLDGHRIYCKLAADDQKQRYGGAQYPSDGFNMPGGTPNIQYGGARPQAAVPMFTQPSMSSIYNTSLTVPQQGVGTRVSHNLQTPPFAQGFISGGTQAQLGLNQSQTHMGYNQHTGMTPYASQSSTYGTDAPSYGASYSGGAMYGTQQDSLAPQTTVTQGTSQYAVTSQAAPMQGHGQYSMAPQTASVQGSSQYGTASQTTVMQAPSQYTVASYQNFRSNASSIAAPTADQLPSAHQFY